VLTFVARRIESDPIVLLAAVRDGYPSALADAGLPELRLSGLDDTTAAALLDVTAPGLFEAARERVLRDATGNPLALVELPELAASLDDTPLSERLERAFATPAGELPEATRAVLLAAALDDADDLGEILQAASIVVGSPLGIDAAKPAADALLIDLDVDSIRFRHPLMHSAIRQSAALQERRRVHEAPATTLEADPDRRVWHRAALLNGPHEPLAGELEAAGERARRRSAIRRRRDRVAAGRPAERPRAPGPPHAHHGPTGLRTRAPRHRAPARA
jgi:hypothetical protein